MTFAPALSGTPLLGVLPELRRDALGCLERARREHGDVVRLLAGPPGMRTEIHALFHPDAVHRVLAGRADGYRKDSRLYAEVRRSLGDGLLNSQDDRWRRQRRFIQPLFTRRRIAGYAAAMGEEAEALAVRWRAAARRGEPVDLHAEMSRLTLRVVGTLLFGADVGRAVPVVARAFPIVGEHARRRAYNPASPPRSWPTRGNRRAAAAQAALRRVCDEVIGARRAAAATGDDRTATGDDRAATGDDRAATGDDRAAAAADDRAAPAADLVGLLVAARDGGEALDDAEIRDQVLIFLLAGHDTTAIALTFALHLLGHHPRALARVQAEVDGVLGEQTPGAEDVEHLPYTTMVLKEAMRLYPPAWATGRRTAEGDDIGGFRLPPGADVIVSPWVTHRHPGLWTAPEAFEPERFSPEREAARHRHAYFPFGAGPRACIGQYFSMLEATIALAVVVRDLDVETAPGRPALAPRITLQPAGPVPARLRLRSPARRPVPAAAR